jgi:hypothetical protein
MRLQNSTRPFSSAVWSNTAATARFSHRNSVDGRFTADADRTKEGNGIPPQMMLLHLPQVHGSSRE